MPSETKHICTAKGCQLEIPLDKLMCRSHWMMVPKGLRDEIWHTYKKARDRKIPLADRHEVIARYRMAVDSAVKFVTSLEVAA